MDGNQFDYQLTENTLSFIERNQRTDEEFDGFKENALRIKNGDIDEDEFSDFRDYLDTLPRKPA